MLDIILYCERPFAKKREILAKIASRIMDALNTLTKIWGMRVKE